VALPIEIFFLRKKEGPEPKPLLGKYFLKKREHSTREIEK
jgi:hypothetical protein